MKAIGVPNAKNLYFGLLRGGSSQTAWQFSHVAEKTGSDTIKSQLRFARGQVDNGEQQLSAFRNVLFLSGRVSSSWPHRWLYRARQYFSWRCR